MILLTTQTGFLKPIAWLLGQIFNGLFNLIYNIAEWFTDKPYHVPIIGISVILFTIIVRLILLPMTIKQQKFSKLSGLMNPELQEIQAKYKDKRDQVSMMNMQAETKAVYEKYGTSPTGGCLTMLIQLPIMFALYRVIYKIPGYVTKIRELCGGIADKITGSGDDWATKLDAINGISVSASTGKATLIDKIYNLSPEKWSEVQNAFSSVDFGNAYDQIHGYNNLFGISLTQAPGWRLSWALIIPILAGLTQWLSVKLMENKNNVNVGSQNDQQAGMASSMKVMNTIMPILSAVFCVSFASCIGLYWIASSVVQIVVQLVINKKMNNKDVDEIVKENIEKANIKRAKKGLPPVKISNVTSKYVEQVHKMEARENRKEERDKEIKESTSYYNTSAKPGSLAAKANMVKMFNEKNNNSK
ncbi:YidC/Oxa1 family membrane protein insertase [Eshraghiella crossota]|jgi:YidC/Oxa1 family membrane protein insertase|uniref:Membrane protein insertase, YidC/Oxa1 family n=1 Tax=Eshraghiella crossota DSM 2876 TaxID=511680 RepID=D4RY14_9FIRM|nr:YidC/Oxa1 family membrane protein insertase [Butyrivibrio crossotus]EFF69116.1 membrane protein insertase, YidC/Oxa1 family [Butyrivibrio crossotus DSM 2876]UWO50717.1 YidC/Oxa1 family membrane protein insertase [Butyrivibrio crossotus]